MRWRLGLRPRPRWGSLRRSPRPPNREWLRAFGASQLLRVRETVNLIWPPLLRTSRYATEDSVWNEDYRVPELDSLRDVPSRLAWLRLNRLISGHTRLAADMYRYGIKASPACDCGAPYQTSRHIVEECPLRLLDGGFKKLVSCDDDALSWLNSLDIDI